jgi:hypothetical protein
VANRSPRNRSCAAGGWSVNRKFAVRR